MKGFKFIQTLEVTLLKVITNPVMKERVNVYRTAFFNGKAKTITNEDDIEPELETSGEEILTVIDIWLSQGSEWVIDRVESHYLIIAKYIPLNGSSYLQLLLHLRNSMKRQVNLRNSDNEYFRWCHVRHLRPRVKSIYGYHKVLNG